MMVVKTCEGVEGGLPSHLRMMMLVNVIIDFIIGLVPFVGDIVDAVFKCNTRNAVILEKHLREKGAKTLKTQSTQQAREEQQVQIQQDTVDHSLPDEWDKQESGVVDNSPPAYQEQGQSGSRQADNAGSQPTKPAPTKQPRGNRSFGKWFGGASRQDEDLERGV